MRKVAFVRIKCANFSHMFCPTPDKTNKKGFTLVEVLIVLVIISIMSGLLITVIDPVKQRARARDGTISATANKLIATIAAYNSALGIFPSCAALAGAVNPEIQNVVAATRFECGGTTEISDGSFVINGISMPSTCDSGIGYVVADGTAICKFRYETNGDSAGNGATQACLGAKLNATADLDGNGSANRFLYWSSATGIMVDNDGTTLCNL